MALDHDWMFGTSSLSVALLWLGPNFLLQTKGIGSLLVFPSLATLLNLVRRLSQTGFSAILM